jgi:hypothetical protein
MFALRDVMKTASPAGAIADFVAVYRQAGRNRWWIALVAAATTFTMFWSLTHETWKRPRELPQVIYITTIAQDRSDAESLAFRKARQAEREAREAAYAAADAEGRRLYRELGAATGMDVDAIEARAEAERQAAAAAEKAKVDAILKQNSAPVAGE